MNLFKDQYPELHSMAQIIMNEQGLDASLLDEDYSDWIQLEAMPPLMSDLYVGMKEFAAELPGGRGYFSYVETKYMRQVNVDEVNAHGVSLVGFQLRVFEREGKPLHHVRLAQNDGLVVERVFVLE